MHATRKNMAKGFTLVEILIVVVILGILAAIVVPQFTNAANEARVGNVATQVSTIENQLELWAARNGGAYPDLATAGETWQDLVDDVHRMLLVGQPKAASAVGTVPVSRPSTACRLHIKFACEITEAGSVPPHSLRSSVVWASLTRTAP